MYRSMQALYSKYLGLANAIIMNKEKKASKAAASISKKTSQKAPPLR